MPSVPPFTISEAAHTYAAGPVDTFVLRPNSHPPSILDTVFVSKRSRRAVYATTTDAEHETSLWRVGRDGQLMFVAKFGWECPVHASNAVGDGSLRNVGGHVKKVCMVSFGGRVARAEEFLRKGKGWFNSDSKVFSVDDVEYKWKSGNENTSTGDGIYARAQSTSYHEMWKIWRCVAVNPATSTVPLSTMRMNNGTDKNTSIQLGADGTTFGDGTSGVPHHQIDIPSTSVPSPSTRLHSYRSANAPSLPQHSHRQSLESFGAAHDALSPCTSKARAIISPILSAPAPPTVLARFAPPQLGLIHHELALFSPVYSTVPSSSSSAGVEMVSNVSLLESLLVSAILLVTNKGEWRHVKSLADPDTLQAVFAAEARGELPPYTSRVGRVGPPFAALGPDATATQRTRTRAHSQPLERPRTSSGETHSRTTESHNQTILSIFRSNPHRSIRSADAHAHEENRGSNGRRPLTTESSTACPAGDGIFARRPSRATALASNSNVDGTGEIPGPETTSSELQNGVSTSRWKYQPTDGRYL